MNNTELKQDYYGNMSHAIVLATGEEYNVYNKRFEEIQKELIQKKKIRRRIFEKKEDYLYRIKLAADKIAVERYYENKKNNNKSNISQVENDIENNKMSIFGRIKMALCKFIGV